MPSQLARNTKFYDTADDSTTIQLPDTHTLMVEAISGPVTVEISMNTHIELRDTPGTCDWYAWQIVPAGAANILFLISEYGPNAIRIVGGGNTFKTWVKG